MSDWREILRKAGIEVHPAAACWEVVHDDDLLDLAQDIEEYGLRNPLALWRLVEGAPWQLMAGQRRVAAMASLPDGELMVQGAIAAANQYEAHVDPIAFAVSENGHRRPNGKEERMRAAQKLLALDPRRSDRFIAKAVGLSHPKVAAIRREAEQTGMVEKISTRVGSDGVAQPATKPPPAPRQARPPHNTPTDPREATRAIPPPRHETAEEFRRRMREAQAEETEHRVNSSGSGADAALERFQAWVKRLGPELDYLISHPVLATRLPRADALALGVRFVVAIGLTVEELERHVNSSADEVQP